MALGCVAWAGGHHHVVLADRRVVDLVDHNAFLVDNLLDRLGLHRVNLDHIGLTVLTNDPRHPLGVVNLGDQVNQLPGDVPHAARQVVAVVVSTHITLTLTRKNRLS